jgi:hypothetical protein
MNIKDWEKLFDKEFSKEAQSTSSLDLYDFYEFGMYEEVKDFIKDLLSQSNQEIVKEILDRVDKEVIGENTDESEALSQNDLIKICVENTLKAEQRQKLTQLRQSNNLLGEKK